MNYEVAGKTVIPIDESGFANDMPRRNGYAPRGQRCVGQCDWHAKGRTNVIGALVGSDFLTVTLIDGTINANVFFAWLTQDLLPKLPPHSVIVMDNASFHKRLDSRLAIAQAGHILEFLPPYSPDLNPIEHKWAQAKAIRKQFRCSVETLFASFVS